jgi:hypothetical protein
VFLVAVVAFAFFSLVLFRPGLLRRRAIAGAFAAGGIVAALVANAVTNDTFLVAAACLIPVLLGLLVQEMADGVAAAASSTRDQRRRRRRQVRERSAEERERARRERERERIAA